MKTMQLQILGIRGIPAQHGGFETFAERFAIFLQQTGWEVTVYCQEDGDGEIYEDIWRGIRCVHIPVSQKGAKGTVIFDWKSTVIAAKKKILVLTLGYNTALFCVLYRLYGTKNIINMDGIEWRRAKWSPSERLWLYCNEKVGAWVGNHLIADHPMIKQHLTHFVPSSKVTVIPYTADYVESADEKLLFSLGLKRNSYALLIARPEPENSILDIVSAYSSSIRGIPLVVLGEYISEENNYHRKVFENAGDEIIFAGAIYDKSIVRSLRFHCRFYIHGHTVGGTNPSLVEALGVGSPVLAHDNKFNRWVAGENAYYFKSKGECSEKIEKLIKEEDLLKKMRLGSYRQHKEYFDQARIHLLYLETLLEQFNE